MKQDIKNILDVIFKFGDWVNTFWTVYIVINVSVIGWVTSSTIAWNWEKKLFVTLGYSIIVLMNLYAQYRTTKLIGVAIKELKAMIIAEDAVTTEEMRNVVLNFRYIDTPLIVSVHLVMDAIVILCIWLRDKF